VKQSRLMSMIETCLNTAIGFAIAIATQLLVFPLFGFAPPLSTNLQIGLIFTVVSIVRGFVFRRLFEFLHIRRPQSPFVTAVIEERFRQVEAEGWSIEHDDAHKAGELARAGSCYARWAGNPMRGNFAPDEWPWSIEWWKPNGFRRDLVRAAALILAEGEKFDRARSAKPKRQKSEHGADSPRPAPVASAPLASHSDGADAVILARSR